MTAKEKYGIISFTVKLLRFLRSLKLLRFLERARNVMISFEQPELPKKLERPERFSESISTVTKVRKIIQEVIL